MTIRSQGKGTMMTTSFKTIDDVVERYVRPTLGGWAKLYNLEDIAYEITYCPIVRDGDYVCLYRSQRILIDVHDPYSEFFDADMFWAVAEDSRKGN